jgi:UDP-N-acetylmuramate dehydrogenase
MIVRERVPLAPLTSLGVGGSACFYIEASSGEDLYGASAFARERGLPLRLLGAGTNVLVPDAGVEAVVVRLARDTVSFATEGGEPLLLAESGVSWDTLVDLAVARTLWGIENLAGIPGSVGGALVQNIGAYGTDLSHTFRYAEVFDHARGVTRRVEAAEAALSYRTSLFKGRHDFIILRIALSLSDRGEPDTSYADLAALREEGAALTTPGHVASAVRSVRAKKFPRDEGSAGSFFKNPVVSGEVLASLTERFPGLPAYPVAPAEAGAPSHKKIPLAWLLDKALGLAGYARGPVRLFERQPLVIVAMRGARASDVEALAREVEDRVAEAFGIMIEREVETFC